SRAAEAGRYCGDSGSVPAGGRSARFSTADEAASARNVAFSAYIEHERTRMNICRNIFRNHRVRALITATQEDVHRTVILEKPRLGDFSADFFLVVWRQLIFLSALFPVVNRNPVKGMPGSRRRTSNGVLARQ